MSDPENTSQETMEENSGPSGPSYKCVIFRFSNISSQPIPAQKTAKPKNRVEKQQGKRICNIYQILLQSHA